MPESPGAIALVEASLAGLARYDAQRAYTPKEREPYDALSDRFVRAVEVSLRFFRTYERHLYAENSETLRDLLNRVDKLRLIDSVALWIEMRDVRNRIVHDYLPEQIQALYDLVMGRFGDELIRLGRAIENIASDNLSA